VERVVVARTRKVEPLRCVNYVSANGGSHLPLDARIRFLRNSTTLHRPRNA
jgi:hypothetical protein